MKSLGADDVHARARPVKEQEVGRKKTVLGTSYSAGWGSYTEVQEAQKHGAGMLRPTRRTKMEGRRK